MGSHCAVYVDVGYLLASAATRVSGTSLRKGIHVEYGKLVSSLIEQAEEMTGLPVLRVHWYDSARDGLPDIQQERIGELPKVKLRLGRFGVDGQQKGVDLRIGLDLVAHARHNTAEVFVLISGDDDLTEAVEEAQAHGVQVLVAAVPNPADKPHAVSRHLLRAADDLRLIEGPTLDRAVMKVEVPRPQPEEPKRPSPLDLAALPRPVAPQPPSSVIKYSASAQAEPIGLHEEEIDTVVNNLVGAFRKSASAEVLAEVHQNRPSIPRELDRALLLDLADALSVYDLSDTVRFRLRERFWQHFDGEG